MKSYTLLISLFGLLLFNSCKKEEPSITTTVSGIEETVNPEMTETNIKMASSVTFIGDERGGYSGALSSYSWILDYRLANGYKSDNKVFYPVEKKWKVNGHVYEMEEYTITETYAIWKKESQWSHTDRLYRFDPNTNQALIYHGENDQNPTQIMDFNIEAGDIWYFDQEDEMCLLVKEKFTIQSNGNTYPALVVEFKSQHETSKNRLWSYETLITPLNPNPILMGENFKNLRYPTWDVFKTDAFVDQPNGEWIPERNLISQTVRSGLRLRMTWNEPTIADLEKDFKAVAEYYVDY